MVLYDMNEPELKRVPFINPDESTKSFSLRIAGIMSCQDKYLMVQNEGESKFKHPGGHLRQDENYMVKVKKSL
jgi:hypothetical protein